MSELTSMKNIGSEIAKKLESVGVETAESLHKVGSREAYLRLRAKYPEVCLVHLYALEGAVSDMDYNRLPVEIKKSLKEFSDEEVC